MRTTCALTAPLALSVTCVWPKASAAPAVERASTEIPSMPEFTGGRIASRSCRDDENAWASKYD